VRSVLAELIAVLPADKAVRVRGIPMVFNPDPTDINAFAGCDKSGAPFIAGTEGLLEAIDAIAQTRSTDEMFATRTYEQYAQTVLPQIARSDKATAALPIGVIPANLALDVRRLSRAHEMFDDMVSFTFGHELSHHYLGHTGCANGQAAGLGPALEDLGRLFTSVAPPLNQFNEQAADTAGAWNAMDAGRARAPNYRWSEAGALSLLDFFSRMESAMGLTPLNPRSYIQDHASANQRIGWVQAVAFTWHAQHPG
jgi:hypothetical protein